MIWKDALKRTGVNIHVIATGAGAGLQQLLWEVPGSSAYLSGCSFPYDQDEQAELLGFMPEHFCSEEAAVDLASAAYMKAYKFGGKRPVGVGLTASVASEKEHRGDHRIYACVITNDFVRSANLTLEKGIGEEHRLADGEASDALGFHLMMNTIFDVEERHFVHPLDSTAMAMERFWKHPFFAANGKRSLELPNSSGYALMPGAFNPPHEGHFGMVQEALKQYNLRVVFETTAEPPHKEALSVQDLLKRAKLLQGYDRLFTRKAPFYLDKAKAYPGVPFVMGADAALRMLDPKWGLDVNKMLEEFLDLGTRFYVADRVLDGRFMCIDDCLDTLSDDRFVKLFKPLDGQWDISSSEIRKKSL